MRKVQGDLHENPMDLMHRGLRLHRDGQTYEARFIIVQLDSPYDFIVSCKENLPAAPKTKRELVAHPRAGNHRDFWSHLG